MMDNSSVAQRNNVLTLKTQQDVRDAGALQRSLIELSSSGEPASIDCNMVEQLDAASVQLLLAAKREAGDLLQIIASTEGEAAFWFRQAGAADQLLGPEAHT